VPTFIGLIFGTVGSIIATIILSLLKWDLISPPQFVGLENFSAF
jgi:multiple sugar transport system permease protein